MKPSKAKKPQHKPQAAPPPAPARRSLPRWAVLGAGLLLAGVGTWALFEFVIWNVTPPALVGKWVVTEGPQEGATFDFFRNGTLVGRVNIGGKEGVLKAGVRVEGDKIYATTRHPETGREDTRVQVIRTLTARALVVEDEQGQVLHMERAD